MRALRNTATLAALLRDLVNCDDPRLVAAIPCLIMNAAHAEPALASVAVSLDGASRRRLGVVHRVARALAVSREPDLRQTFGAAPQMTLLACEPSDLPDPLDDHGEELLRELRDPETPAGAEWGALAGDMEDMFDTWLRLSRAPGVCRA